MAFYNCAYCVKCNYNICAYFKNKPSAKRVIRPRKQAIRQTNNHY